MKRALRLYDRAGAWLTHNSWATNALIVIAIVNVCFFAVTAEGCALEPLPAQYSEVGK